MRGWVTAGILALAGPAVAEVSDLERAVRAGDAVAAAAALAAGASPDAALSDGMMTPLGLAAARADVPMMRALLAGGADPDATGAWQLTPLAAAAQSCAAGVSVVAILLSSGADPDLPAPGHRTPLLIAAQKGRGDLIAVLAAAGADGDAVDGFGEGALNYAIYARDPALVQEALAAGATTGQLHKLFLTRGFRTADWPGPARCDQAG